MSKKNPFADLKGLRREDNVGGQQFVKEAAELEQEAPKPHKRWRREFVRVPWEWAERLQAAKRISSWRLAVLLLYEHWRTGGCDIAIVRRLTDIRFSSPPQTTPIMSTYILISGTITSATLHPSQQLVSRRL